MNLVMILCLLVVMDYSYTTNATHEILGLFLGLLFIIHNALNRHWYNAIGKGKMNILRILSTITNVLLLVMILLVTVTGVLISQTVFSVIPLSQKLWVHQLHTLSAYLGFILSAIHLGFRWNALWGKISRRLRIDCMNFRYIILSRIALLLIIGYGIYTSFIRHIGSRLLLQHGFNDWTSTPSLVGFVFDHMAIMGCYAAITYLLTQMLQKQNHRHLPCLSHLCQK